MVCYPNKIFLNLYTFPRHLHAQQKKKLSASENDKVSFELHMGQSETVRPDFRTLIVICKECNSSENMPNPPIQDRFPQRPGSLVLRRKMVFVS